MALKVQIKIIRKQLEQDTERKLTQTRVTADLMIKYLMTELFMHRATNQMFSLYSIPYFKHERKNQIGCYRQAKFFLQTLPNHEVPDKRQVWLPLHARYLH